MQPPPPPPPAPVAQPVVPACLDDTQFEAIPWRVMAADLVAMLEVRILAAVLPAHVQPIFHPSASSSLVLPYLYPLIPLFSNVCSCYPSSCGVCDCPQYVSANLTAVFCACVFHSSPPPASVSKYFTPLCGCPVIVASVKFPPPQSSEQLRTHKGDRHCRCAP